MVNTTAQSAVVWNSVFHCTLTTNATGASGTIMGDGWYASQFTTGTTAGNVAVNNLIAAQTVSTNLQDTLYIVFTPTSGTATGVSLTDLHIRPF